MLNEFVPTRYETPRLTDLSQLIVEELLIVTPSRHQTILYRF